ncbi:type II toxin-antitoxin system VapC family toxin [Dolichospermum planctonicum UHCC 0167]|uniref:type II toxin-antitoxin system VapC family toxin n=1 Tax=Dolichospermum planctonicum TaxID=136072 RepID=UPI0014436F5B|nr:type II toxin-antitoxin system VapC family toxin [Dolichospermum planctonicum]MCW9680019.1 type II toxin-antitoxin system VapC family toxin [Dolichospermum planctonicum UHCC 0167]
MIILDTHAWIWWITESKNLSVQATEAINKADIIGIAAISCWELAMLVAKNRIGLSMDVQIWINLALQHPKIQLLALTPEIAVLSTRLPGNFHGDPADRLIVASSLVHKAQLISKDDKIKQWGYLQVIW